MLDRCRAHGGSAFGARAIDLGRAAQRNMERLVERRHGKGGVAQDRQVGRDRAHQLFGVDVDADELAAELQGLGLRVHFGLAEFGTDGQHQVGLRDRRMDRREGHVFADAQGVRWRQDALGIHRVDHGCIEMFGQGTDASGRIGSTATEDEEWCLGRFQPFRCQGDVGCLRRRALRQGTAGDDDGINPGRDDIDGDLDMDRARPRTGEERESPRQHLRQLIG